MAMKDHFVVVVQIKHVHHEADSKARGPLGDVVTKGERSVDDMVNVVTTAVDARAALLKTMRLLEVELEDFDNEETLTTVADDDPLSRAR